MFLTVVAASCWFHPYHSEQLAVEQLTERSWQQVPAASHSEQLAVEQLAALAASCWVEQQLQESSLSEQAAASMINVMAGLDADLSADWHLSSSLCMHESCRLVA
jgi:2-oxo-4-hydroxy-4-carboxy--5-ureidoimidazoline (OHCU) decarboxylase